MIVSVSLFQPVFRGQIIRPWGRIIRPNFRKMAKDFEAWLPVIGADYPGLRGADYPAQISAPYTEGRAAKSLAIFWPEEPEIFGGGADYPA